MKKELRYLEKHKALCGFADYKLLLKDSTSHDSGDVVAEAEGDYLDKTLTVTLFKKYTTTKDWKNVLIHELVHARFGLALDKIKDRTKDIAYLEEEEAVNDITRGIMSLLESEK